jgi:hypothetical protein
MSDIKMTKPWIPVGHPNYKWTSGADVQALWRKYGWAPPSEKMTPPPVVVDPRRHTREKRRSEGA